MSTRLKPRSVAYWRRRRFLWRLTACVWMFLALLQAMTAYSKFNFTGFLENERAGLNQKFRPGAIAQLDPILKQGVEAQRTSARIHCIAAVIFLVCAGLALQGSRRATRGLEKALETENVCVQCGYDLRGLPEHRCPECGRSFVPLSSGPP